MEIVTLDLTDCKYMGELHRRIKEVFHFPDYYGENWDAFYDLMCTDSKAEKVIIRGLTDAPKTIQQAIEVMVDTLQDVQAHHKRFGKVLSYEKEDV